MFRFYTGKFQDLFDFFTFKYILCLGFTRLQSGRTPWLPYLNTSYVQVLPPFPKKSSIGEVNLNTSYVQVLHYQSAFFFSCFPYLNTSYVQVLLQSRKRLTILQIYLNTSYVQVLPCMRSKKRGGKQNLNTSYVQVLQLSVSSISSFSHLFKYILCLGFTCSST